MTAWWWLSFADGDRPKNEQFLGVAIVQARSLHEAIKAAWALGCNPGGQVMGADVPPEIGPPPEGYAGRLLSRVECEAMQALWTPDDPEVGTEDEHRARSSS